MNPADEFDRIKEHVAEIVCQLLWRHQAVQINSSSPFKLSSGNFTPLYINCRLLISAPETRALLTAFAHYYYHQEALEADTIAGGETAGIPFGAWLAESLDKPFVYVRKQPKGHGTEGQVEGIAQGQVLLMEDLITDGGSKLTFIDGIRAAGCLISDCLVLVDREQDSTANLAKVGVRLHTLMKISTCLARGTAQGWWSAHDQRAVEEYLADSEQWHRARGLAFTPVG
jgi:orotate phosphoribosyltransferase